MLSFSKATELFFFFKSFWRTHVLFLGPLVPLFWISGDVSSGFQSQSGFCLIRYFCGGECNVHSPRFTSGTTLANLLAAGVQPVTSPHACAEVGLGSDSNVQPHEQKTNALPLCQRPSLGDRTLVSDWCADLNFQCNWIVLLIKTMKNSFPNFYSQLNKCIMEQTAQKSIHRQCLQNT